MQGYLFFFFRRGAQPSLSQVKEIVSSSGKYLLVKRAFLVPGDMRRLLASLAENLRGLTQECCLNFELGFRETLDPETLPIWQDEVLLPLSFLQRCILSGLLPEDVADNFLA